MQASLHFHGACGECFRDFYKVSAAELSLQVSKISPSDVVSLAFIRQLGKAVDGVGQDFYSTNSMGSHYRNFRSRSHFGRSLPEIELNSSIEVFRGEKNLVVDSAFKDDSFRDRFVRAVEESRERAVATGFFVNDDVDLAIGKIISGDRLTTDGIDASYIISVSVQVSGGVVYSFMVDKAGEGYEYAFYVMNGNERVMVSWYRKEPYFECPFERVYLQPNLLLWNLEGAHLIILLKFQDVPFFRFDFYRILFLLCLNSHLISGFPLGRA